MENSSKALIIAGAIIICVLLVAVGMFIYNSAGSSIDDSMTAMSTSEIEAHNSEYTMYDGEQTGSNVKSLIRIIISNANLNKDEVAQIPGVYFEDFKNKKNLDSGLPVDGDSSAYLDGLQAIQSSIDVKHKYWVEVNYQKNGLIDYINISYDQNNLIEPMKRN